VPPKNNIDLLKIFYWENILVKSPYYEEKKKVNTPLVPQPRKPTQEITPYPSQYHLIKLLYFSSSLKPHPNLSI
jgi:hypothetical protein